MMRALSMLALAALLGGCGSHSSHAPSDRQLVVAMTLRLSDFPPGWSRATQRAGARDACAISHSGLTRTATTKQPGVPTFSHGSQESVLSGASAFASTAQAKADFARDTSAAHLACQTAQLARDAPHGEVYSKPGVSHPVFPVIGQASSLVAFTVPVASLTGARFPLYIEQLTWRIGNGVGQQTAVTVGTGFSPTLFLQLAHSAERRSAAVEAQH